MDPDITAVIQAKNFTHINRGSPTVVVVHSAESGDGPGSARAVATWFASANAPQASAHMVVDRHDTVMCVHEEFIAWAAPGCNQQGVHIELCGHASQTVWPEDLLRRAAAVVAHWCYEFGIPVTKIGPSELLGGASGICGHVDVSKAWKKSTHYDPGPAFPWNEFIDMVDDAGVVDTERMIDGA